MCWLKGKVELFNNKLARNISDGNTEFIRLKKAVKCTNTIVCTLNPDNLIVKLSTI